MLRMLATLELYYQEMVGREFFPSPEIINQLTNLRGRELFKLAVKYISNQSLTNTSF